MQQTAGGFTDSEIERTVQPAALSVPGEKLVLLECTAWADPGTHRLMWHHGQVLCAKIRCWARETVVYGQHWPGYTDSWAW